MTTTIAFCPNTYSFIGNDFPTCSPDDFVKRISDKKQLYEVVPNNKQCKMYFDCEAYLPVEDYNTGLAEIFEARTLEYLTLGIKSICDIEPNIAKATSHSSNIGDNEAKLSVRYFVSNIKTNTFSNKKFVENINILIKSKFDSCDNIFEYVCNDRNKQIFDESVYSNNKKMRCINTSKPNEDRPLLLQSGSINNTIITSFFDANCFEYIVVDVPIVRTITTLTNKENKDNKNTMLLEECILHGLLNNITSYNDYVILGFGLYNTFGDETGFYFYNKICQNYPRHYDYDGLVKSWKECASNANGKVSFGSVLKFAKDTNSELFMKLQKEVNVKFANDTTDLYNPMFTSGLIADYFVKLYKDLFICVDGYVYMYNGVYWKKDDDKAKNICLSYFVDKTFVIDLLNYANLKSIEFTKELALTTENNDVIKAKIEKVNALRTNINTLRKVGVRKTIIEDIINFITQLSHNIELDNNPYLFAFENKIYDLKIGAFVEPQPTFYMSKTCGYSYDDNYNPNLVQELDTIINNIFPDNDIRNYYLSVLATGLCGLQIEKCFIATGRGGNGKSLINSLMLKTVGSYGYVLPSNILLNEIKSGANPEVANLHNIRFALTQEPNAKKKICCSTLKELTGSPTLNVRDLYSSKCSINLKLSLVIECNDKPLLDEVNEAMNRRMRMALFESMYVSQENYNSIVDKTNVYVENSFYKTDDFKSQYKQALFMILLKKFDLFRINKFEIIEQPKRCAEMCKEYMATSDDIFGWFRECYKTEPNETSEPIMLTDIFKEFEKSSFYDNLSKNDKRKYNRKNFTEKIENNMFIKRFILRKGKYHNKLQVNSDSIIGWVKMVEMNDAEIV